jgi:DNA-binding NarL/FixJ family response regulator
VLSTAANEAELRLAIGRLVAGETYVSAELEEAGEVSGAKLNALTSAESEVFLLLAGGSSVVEIAAQLSTSAKTTSHHYTSTKRKLCKDNMAQLALYAVRSDAFNPH